MNSPLIALALLFALVVFSSSIYAQECGDEFCDSGAGEDEKTCPSDCAPKDLCENVECKDSEVICPDGFISACKNTCEKGECSTCEPSCEGHEKEEDNSDRESKEKDDEFICGNEICEEERGEDNNNCPQDCKEDVDKEDCPEFYSPVCGKDKRTYPNECFALKEGIDIDHGGECKEDHLCPDSIVCSSGEEVTCTSSDGICDCKCPVPDNCEAVVDENGYEHIFCTEPVSHCPPVKKEQKEKCIEQGGQPESVIDHNTCEQFTCIFHDGPGFFTQSQCPEFQEVKQRAESCTELGLEGKIVKEGGCRVAKCVEQERHCEEEDFAVREKKEDQCREQGLEVRKDYDPISGCEITVCTQEEQFCKRELPRSAIKRCDEQGGELLVDRDDNDCIIIDSVFCLREGRHEDVEYVEVREVPSEATLLALALQIENLNVQFRELLESTDELRKYYKAQGSTDEERYKRIVAKIREIINNLEDIKGKLSDELDTITTDQLSEYRHEIGELREDIMDIVRLLLSKSQDVVNEIELEQAESCGQSERCFDKHLRNCVSTTFFPDGTEQGPRVELKGTDDQGACIMTVTMSGGFSIGGLGEFSMECHISEYSRGMEDLGEQGPTAETMDLWNCRGSMADAIRSGQFFGPEEDEDHERGSHEFEEPRDFRAERFEEGKDFDEFDRARFALEDKYGEKFGQVHQRFADGEISEKDFEEQMRILERDFERELEDISRSFHGDESQDVFEEQKPSRVAACEGCWNDDVCTFPRECQGCPDCVGETI